jgi:hypothetical protein
MGLLAGYLGSALRRAPRYEDEDVIGALREAQRARNVVKLVRSRLRARAA